ncbi:MAG: hypothetical protein EOO32_04790 [Comamonadaceae bacterium]|nr:MAG: hypothetical protein EOO32_04790 [Comamonadaceae bacterium]
MKYSRKILGALSLVSSHTLCLAQGAPAQQPASLNTPDLSDSRIVRDLIVCSGPVWASLRPQDKVYPKDQFSRIYWKAYRELFAKWINLYGDDSVKISENISGVFFSGLIQMPIEGEIGTISYSPTASPEMMRKMLENSGAVMRGVSEVKMLNRNVSEWNAVKAVGEVMINYRFIEGQLHLNDFKNKFGPHESKGVTLICSAREATAEQEQAQGIVGVKQAESVLAVNAPPSSQWFRKLLSHGTKNAKLAVAEHLYLEGEQVRQLLELKDAAVSSALVDNAGVNFSTTDIDLLIQSEKSYVIDALIKKYHTRFTSQQRSTLFENARWRSSLLLLSGGKEAVQELKRLYSEESRADIIRGLALLELSKFGEGKLPLIDVIIQQGAVEDRRLLVSYAGIMYSPEQVKILLQDEDPQVRNGLLRRKDLNIDADFFKKNLP